jgi:hypothetical protein
MLPREKRVVQEKEIIKIQRYGRRFSEDNLQLQVLENGREKSRAGFIVGIPLSWEYDFLKKQWKGMRSKENYGKYSPRS